MLNQRSSAYANRTNLDDQIEQTLTRPLSPGESHRTGNDNRERELYGHFEQLLPAELLGLRQRIQRLRPDDRLSEPLRRLTEDRRQRICAALTELLRRRPR